MMTTERKLPVKQKAYSLLVRPIPRLSTLLAFTGQKVLTAIAQHAKCRFPFYLLYLLAVLNVAATAAAVAAEPGTIKMNAVPECDSGADASGANRDPAKNAAQQTLATVRSARHNAGSLPSFPAPVLRPGLFLAPEPVDSISRSIKDYVDALSNRIYANWQPADSCPQKSFRLHFFVDIHGQFQDITLRNPSNDAKANSACIEAVRKTSGFRSKVPMSINEVEFRLNRSEKE
jgi:hypothetical protein